MALLSTLFAGPLRPMLARPGLKPGIYVATGPSVLPDWALRSVCVSMSETDQVFWVDAGNNFDAYGAAKTLRALGKEPRRVLARVRLARPFNAFQMEAMAIRKLPKLFWGQPIILSDPLKPLYDEDLSPRDARAALEGTLSALADLPTAVLVLLPDRPAPQGREIFLERFMARARSVTRLESRGSGRWELVPFESGVPALACA